MIPVRAYYRLLSSYLRPQRARVVLLTVVLFTSIGLQLFNPQLIKRFIDGATGGAPAEELIPIAVAFILVAVVHQGLSIWSTYLAEDVGWSATNQLRMDLTDHVLHLDMGFHKAHAPGELIERIDGDITSLSNFFSAMTIKVVGNGLLHRGDPRSPLAGELDHRPQCDPVRHLGHAGHGSPPSGGRSSLEGRSGNISEVLRFCRRADRRDRGHPSERRHGVHGRSGLRPSSAPGFPRWSAPGWAGRFCGPRACWSSRSP